MSKAQARQDGAAGGANTLPPHVLYTVFVFIMLLLSCRTAPPVMPNMDGEVFFIPLEPGGLIYIFIDTEGARPILDNLSFRGMDTDDRQFRRILDSTSHAMAAVYSEPAGSRIRLVAQGRYPSGRARMAMRSSRHWRGHRSQAAGVRYWHSAAGMISVTMSRSEALLSTSICDAPVDPFYAGPGTRMPEGFDAFRRGTVISCWIENPGMFINQRLGEMHIPFEIPAEQFFIGLFPVSGTPGPNYEVYLRIQVANENQARGFASLLALARAMFTPPANMGSNIAAVLMSILLANPTVAEGRYLHIRTSAMNADEVSLLFSQLLP
ncbi:MAG: hypothetical protein FWD88_06245 [Treponema sp.]|nr:hypothetical protein [Treponema sp.]